MVRPIVITNLLIGLLLLSASAMSIKQTWRDINEYGWTYTKTITINGESTTETISNYAMIYSTLLIGFVSILCFMNIPNLVNSTALKLFSEEDKEGITFPYGNPEKWDITFDPRTVTIGVRLNDLGVSFPLSMISKWSSQYDEKQVDELQKNEMVPLTQAQAKELVNSGYVYLDHETHEGWMGDLPFYAFVCPEHGLMKDYTHGFENILSCKICRKKLFKVREKKNSLEDSR